jgi:hypothetical protein
MNLTIRENNIINTLPVTQSVFVSAKFSPAIKSLSDLDLHNRVIDLIQTTLLKAGVKDQQDKLVIKFISENLLHDLKQPKFNHLSFSEIEMALDLGVKFEYGQYMGVNIATIHSWIKSFLSDKNRENALKEFNKKLNEEEQRTSDKPLHLKVEFSKESAIKAFIHFKNYNEMPIASFAYYDVINDLLGVDYNGVKTLVFDKDIRQKIVKECTELHEKMCLHQKNKLEKKGFINEAENLVNVIIDPKGSKTLERLIKERFLKHFFNELINQNKKLEFNGKSNNI